MTLREIRSNCGRLRFQTPKARLQAVQDCFRISPGLLSCRNRLRCANAPSSQGLAQPLLNLCAIGSANAQTLPALQYELELTARHGLKLNDAVYVNDRGSALPPCAEWSCSENPNYRCWPCPPKCCETDKCVAKRSSRSPVRRVARELGARYMNRLCRPPGWQFSLQPVVDLAARQRYKQRGHFQLDGCAHFPEHTLLLQLVFLCWRFSVARCTRIRRPSPPRE